MKPIWNIIEDFPNYLINNFGEVMNRNTGRILKQNDNGNGYKTVMMGRGNRRYIHRLVAQTFIDNAHDLKEVNHIDGNKDNNNVDNLEWVTRSGNLQHAYDNGLKVVEDRKGEKNGRSKLTEKDVVEIRKQHKAGNMTQSQLARKYSVKPATIHSIIKKKIWEHVS